MTDGLPGERMVLAEPETEGLLAAALARHGEGPCALYLRAPQGLDVWLRAARARGVSLSPRRTGPLGRSVLAPGGFPAAVTSGGPQIIVIDDPQASSAPAPSGTIAS